jgi:hypothetical protein
VSLTNTQIAVLRFGGRRLPRALASLPCHDSPDATAIDAAVQAASRVVVVGSAADLAAVLTRLMRIERLDVEVALHSRWRGARRALTGVAQRIPLIRDETGTALVGAAFWLPPGDDRVIHGEAVVDDDLLFDGDVTAVRIEPTVAMPGLRAAVLTDRMRPRRWLTGRAVQLGTTGARVVRDGAELPREAKRSAFYRHTTGWLRVS